MGRGKGDSQPAENGVIWSLLGLRHLILVFSTGSCQCRGQQLLLARCPGHVIGVRHKPLATIQICTQHKGVLLHPGNDGPDFCGYRGIWGQVTFRDWQVIVRDPVGDPFLLLSCPEHRVEIWEILEDVKALLSPQPQCPVPKL